MEVMARKRRDNSPGFHHLWARGNNRQMIFLDEGDHERYLSRLAQAAEDYGWNVLAYCLMGNHLHLVLETTRPNLGDGMRWLQSRYALDFNERHQRINHLFGGRYGSVPQRTLGQLKYTVRYVVMNPVAAGLCQFPEEWRWSSHRSIVEGDPPAWIDRGRLLECFADGGAEPLREYVRYVNATDNQVLRLAA